MRFREHASGVTVHAISGTHVVLLGMDIEPARAEGLLGFAIHRTDPTEREAYWLTGMRTFEASYPNPPDGALASTLEHPVQDFLWSDFTAKPGRTYTYKVVPVRGHPKNLVLDPGVEIEVKTEHEDAGEHAVYFNRAAIGSQAYARKFKLPPNRLAGAAKTAAYKWLSRGLEEAMLAFVGQARGHGFGLRAAVYEFSHAPVAAALAQAKKSGADVQIVYDARLPGKPGSKASTQAKKRVDGVKALLKKHGLGASATSTPRRKNPNYISHNKFIVLLHGGKPVAVWTGSTNFTESGIFGQANVGHLVRDPAVAAKYLAYWERLHGDPELKALQTENEAATPTLHKTPPPAGTAPIFSPRSGLAQLQWYAKELDSAAAVSCFTGAFGVNKLFLADYAKPKNFLRYVFLDKWGVSKQTAAETQAVLEKNDDIQVAVGAYLKEQVLHHWLKELDNSLSGHVKFVHTKFLAVDPLGDDPVVATGSANFSDASTKQNDENMLVIRGDRRVADIYLGEFMRLWRHHRFRFIVNRISAKTGKSEGHNYLDPTSAWTKPFFRSGSAKFLRRKTFA